MNKNKITIEWHSIIKDIVKNIWVVVLAALIGAMGTYIAAHSLYEPQYTSGATLVVNAGGNTYSTFSVSSEMANVLTNIFTQPSMEAKAAEHLGVSGFNGSVSANVLADTNFIEVKVTSNNPQTAYDLLGAILEVYPEISANIFQNAYISVLRMPFMPAAPSNSLPTENTNLVVAACITLSLAAIFILSLMRDTVKNEADFNTKIDSKLIGTILHENKNITIQDKIKQKKKGLLIHSNAYISLRFVENFHKIAAKLEYMKHKNGEKIFAITSVAENEGKSTVAANIAVSLADRGYKVVLVDLDGKKPALYKIFGEEYEENSELANLFGNKITQNEFRLKRFKKTSLFLALNTKPCAEYNKWLENGEVEKLLNVLKTKADFIIIDTAPLSLDASVTDIIKIVNKTFMVVRTDTVKTEAINDAVATIGKISNNFAGCILNDVYLEYLPFSFSGNDESNYYGKYGRYGKYGKYGRYGNYYGHYENTESLTPKE